MPAVPSPVLRPSMLSHEVSGGLADGKARMQGWEELMLVVESALAGGRKEVALAAIAVVTQMMQAHGDSPAMQRFMWKRALRAVGVGVEAACSPHCLLPVQVPCASPQQPCSILVAVWFFGYRASPLPGSARIVAVEPYAWEALPSAWSLLWDWPWMRVLKLRCMTAADRPAECSGACMYAGPPGAGQCHRAALHCAGRRAGSCGSV